MAKMKVVSIVKLENLSLKTIVDLIDTPEGTIWLPGDSRLLKEQLEMPSPDVILLDFSDNSWHIGLDDAVKPSNTYPDAES